MSILVLMKTFVHLAPVRNTNKRNRYPWFSKLFLLISSLWIFDYIKHCWKRFQYSICYNTVTAASSKAHQNCILPAVFMSPPPFTNGIFSDINISKNDSDVTNNMVKISQNSLLLNVRVSSNHIKKRIHCILYKT